MKNEIQRIQDRLENYYIQQRNNEFIDDNTKRIIGKVIEECQRIVAEEEMEETIK